MTHFDDGVLRAWLDGEAAPGTDAVAAHLERCPECRERARVLEHTGQAVREALGHLDGPVPADLAWAGVAARIGAAERGAAPGGAHRRWRAFPLGRAAALLALIGAGGVAAATLPGSPLRTLLSPAGRGGPAPAPAPAATPAPAPAAAEAGIRAVDDEAVDVELTAPPGTPIEVVIGGEHAGVFAAPSSEFEARRGWLQATVVEGGVRVELPPTMRTEIRANGSVVATVDDGAFVGVPPAARLDEQGRRLWFTLR